MKSYKWYNKENNIINQIDRTDQVQKISIKYKIAGLLIVIIFISNIFLGILNFDNSKSVASEIIINNNEAELKNISDYYFDKLISSNKHARNWDLFIQLHDDLKNDISTHGSGALTDEFVKAYDEKIKSL